MAAISETRLILLYLSYIVVLLTLAALEIFGDLKPVWQVVVVLAMGTAAVFQGASLIVMVKDGE